MAIEYARLCGSCERKTPSWADRCPACGSLSMIRRLVLIPPTAQQQFEPVTLVLNPKSKTRKQSKPRVARAEQGPVTATTPAPVGSRTTA